eukprot:364647-Chlamydomonas_euryale.AAC.11
MSIARAGRWRCRHGDSCAVAVEAEGRGGAGSYQGIEGDGGGATLGTKRQQRCGREWRRPPPPRATRSLRGGTRHEPWGWVVCCGVAEPQCRRCALPCAQTLARCGWVRPGDRARLPALGWTGCRTGLSARPFILACAGPPAQLDCRCGQQLSHQVAHA